MIKAWTPGEVAQSRRDAYRRLQVWSDREMAARISLQAGVSPDEVLAIGCKRRRYPELVTVRRRIAQYLRVRRRRTYQEVAAVLGYTDHTAVMALIGASPSTRRRRRKR